MNTGKICVSVCAETAEEFFTNIKKAEKFADVIELRFDCLNESELDLVLQMLSESSFKKPFLATFRPKSEDEEFIFGLILDKEYAKQRGKAFQKRISVWKNILTIKSVELIDFEDDLSLALTMSDLFEAHYLDKRQVIFSSHDFSGVPNNLNETFLDLSSAKVFSQKHNVIKIAVQANDVTDSIGIWKLLETAKAENVQIIPIAMGEAGKWTRILGLAHGAFMTYASLDLGNETAPGQISAQDLIETYRVKELDEKTEVFGIIGNPVSQSVSPHVHNSAFKYHKLNAVYIPFEVNNLEEFLQRMVKPKTREIELNFKGFSVTLPHKQAIIPHLDFIDETAKTIGAVNTVKISDGKLLGYNTDAAGFIEPLRNSYGKLENTKVAVLGAGGAARAAVYALQKEGAEVTVFARNPEKAKSFAEEFEVNLKELPKIKDQKSNLIFNDFDILVNSTPLGMKGKFENETPVAASQIEHLKLVYDLVYNPFETALIKEARKANVPTIGGLAMLVAQGTEQFRIWTDLEAPVKEMSAAALRKLK